MNLFSKCKTPLFAVILLYCFSCTPSKKVVYFNDYKDNDSASVAAIKTIKVNFANTIQKNDQLWITVGGSNIEDLVSINSGNGIGATGTGGAVGASSSSVLGYLVESDGKIQLPYLGRIQAEGLTRLQLEVNLTGLVKEYTKDPIVNVRFLNYNFSVMGEVTRSGKYSMSNERVTVLEAISMAGDVTDLGRRDNVIVIREENGERKIGRINLLSKDIFNSPYFYLRTNDVVYVEPVSARFISRTGIPQYFTVVAIGVSILITIINLAKK
ncbi:MAG: polysaccharide biosynthesis/export family protein [Bacteroidota bacterium]